MENIEIIRYPNNDITDWSGTKIDPSIRNYVNISNIVRLELNCDKESFCLYFRIESQCKKKNWFVGVCEDPYHNPELYSTSYKNGDKITFSIYHIMEIPLDWNGNNNLKSKVIYRNERREITGIH